MKDGPLLSPIAEAEHAYNEALGVLQNLAQTFESVAAPASLSVEPAPRLNEADLARVTEELRHAEARYRTLVEQIPAVTFMAALDEGIKELYVSPQIEKLLGFTQREWLEDPVLWYTQLHPEDRTRWHTEFAQTCATGAGFCSEYRFLARDGHVVWVHGEAQLVRDAAGRPLFLQGVAFDITERKRAEEALRRTNDELEARVRARTAELAQANVAAGLTKQLLAYSRKQFLQPKVLDLNQLVAGITPLLARLIGTDIELTSTPAPQPCRIHADAVQLEQVLMNLAVNARDAMPTGGRLLIETSLIEFGRDDPLVYADIEPGSYVLLTVRDTGTGMDKATLARLFEPFFTTKEQGKGTGLGLATVHGIVKQSGGHIRVYSELGRGTVFKIYLPRSGGYTVLVSANGAEAMKLIGSRTGPLDLVVTGIIMPKMGGRQLAEALRRSHPTLPVLFINGFTEDAVIHHSLATKSIAFLQKPFTLSALRLKVRQVLDQKEKN